MAQQRNTANDVTPAFVGEIWERLTSSPHGMLPDYPAMWAKRMPGPDGPTVIRWWCSNDEWWIGCEAFPQKAVSVTSSRTRAVQDELFPPGKQSS